MVYYLWRVARYLNDSKLYTCLYMMQKSIKQNMFSKRPPIYDCNTCKQKCRCLELLKLRRSVVPSLVSHASSLESLRHIIALTFICRSLLKHKTYALISFVSHLESLKNNVALAFMGHHPIGYVNTIGLVLISQVLLSVLSHELIALISCLHIWLLKLTNPIFSSRACANRMVQLLIPLR
jgi:hypothetical protein